MILLSTYSFPVARGIFCGIDLSCFVPQSADTKFFMLPLRILHRHCRGHSDKQYLNHYCFQLFPSIQRYYQLKAIESNRWWHVTKCNICLAKNCSKSSKINMLLYRNGWNTVFQNSSLINIQPLVQDFIRHEWKWSKILCYWDLMFFGLLRLICWKITMFCCKFCRWCLRHRFKQTKSLLILNFKEIQIDRPNNPLFPYMT